MAKNWVLVAENGRARIFSLNNHVDTLQEIESIVDTASRSRRRDMASDRPGRSFDSIGRGRHAMENEVDPKHHETTLFAKQISERLEQGRLNGEYESIVLISSLPFLGILRKSLGANTTKSVTKTISKNLVQKTKEEIGEYLS